MCLTDSFWFHYLTLCCRYQYICGRRSPCLQHPRKAGFVSAWNKYGSETLVYFLVYFFVVWLNGMVCISVLLFLYPGLYRRILVRISIFPQTSGQILEGCILGTILGEPPGAELFGFCICILKIRLSWRNWKRKYCHYRPRWVWIKGKIEGLKISWYASFHASISMITVFEGSEIKDLHSLHVMWN